MKCYTHRFNIQPLSLFNKMTIKSLGTNILFAGCTYGHIARADIASLLTYIPMSKFTNQVTFVIKLHDDNVRVMLFPTQFRILSDNKYEISELDIIMGSIIQLMLDNNIPISDRF